MDGIPPPLDDDDDDVSWALQTAAVEWRRAAYADAIVWLRRAVDAAMAVGKPERARALTLAAEDLARKTAAPAALELEDAPVSDRVSLSMDVEFQPPSEDQPVFEIPRRAPPPRRGAPSPPTPGPAGLPIPRRPPPPRPGGAAATPAAARPVPAPSPSPLAFPPVPTDQPARAPNAQSSRPPPGMYPSRPPDVFAPPAARPAKGSRPPPPPSPPPPAPLPDDISAVEAALSPFSYSRPPPPFDLYEEEAAYRDRPLPSYADEEPESQRASEHPAAPPESAPQEQTPADMPPAVEGRPAAEQPTAPEAQPAAEQEPAATEQRAADVEPGAAREIGEPVVDGISLAEVRGLQDLPEDAQVGLAQSARIEHLGPEEEVGGFGIALVLEGEVRIMPSIADLACAHAAKGEVVFTTGSLEEGVTLRVVAGTEGARVAVWEPEALEEATASCPWVADELRIIADRYQALAGAMMGAMGDRMDDALRALVTGRCDVRLLQGREVLFESGKAVDGMYIVGAGRLELVRGSGEGADIVDELGPGDFLFPAQILAHGAAPYATRAGKTGALLLFAPRMTAHELLVSVPPLLEILSG